MNEWTISPDLVRIVVPLATGHAAIGLGIVGVVMWMRSDSTLRLFGVGIGLFAVALGIRAITAGIHPSEDLLRFFALPGALAMLLSVLVFLRVGVEDYSFNWRRIALVLGIVWAVVLTLLEFWLDAGEPAHYSEAGFVVSNLHAIPAILLIFGLAFAFFEAAHIAVEHSHGEPYRTILLASMSVMALALVVATIADNDALRLIISIVGTVASGVMWISVVVHERKEIAREREEMTRRLVGDSGG